MRCLTIWQPWASMIVGGWKPYEFRNWAAPTSIVGQRIGIHAAKRPIKTAELRDIMDYACSPQGQADGIDIACMNLLERVWRRQVELPMSAVLGTALLGQPKLVQQNLDGPRFAWPMIAADPFADPIPMKGAQGFWNMPA